MFEIELKAHIENYNKTRDTIQSFAQFVCEKSKSDVYWNLDTNLHKEPITVRIREEKTTDIQGAQLFETVVTYKKKEVRNSKEDISYEVNEEHEFSISDRAAFEQILIDTGFVIDLEKQKDVLQWKHNGVLLELCSISHLGNFLELEILSESQNDEAEEIAIQKLQGLLTKCNVPLCNIEKRYYKDLLREKGIG